MVLARPARFKQVAVHGFCQRKLETNSLKNSLFLISGWAPTNVVATLSIKALTASNKSLMLQQQTSCDTVSLTLTSPECRTNEIIVELSVRSISARPFRLIESGTLLIDAAKSSRGMPPHRLPRSTPSTVNSIRLQKYSYLRSISETTPKSTCLSACQRGDTALSSGKTTKPMTSNSTPRTDAPCVTCHRDLRQPGFAAPLHRPNSYSSCRSDARSPIRTPFHRDPGYSSEGAHAEPSGQ